MKAKRFLAAVASLGLAVSMMSAFSLSASADPAYSTTIEGDKHAVFEKYLVMESDAVVPNASFSFTIEPGEAVAAAADGSTLPVLAGIGAPKFTLKTNTDNIKTDNEGSADEATVSFSPADTDVSGTTIAESHKGEGKTVKFVTATPNNDEKYAQKKIDIDFSNVAFTEPGIYRYVITEAAATSQAAGVTNDTNSTRILDVVVVDASAENVTKLKINNYVLHDSAADIPTKGTGDSAPIAHKSTGFTNTYDTHDIEFSKTIAGNQGSRDKYFKFDISISNAKGAQITVNGCGNTFLAEPKKSTTTIYTEANMKAANTKDDDGDRAGQQLNANESGAITASFYLKHGQSIKLEGVPAGAKYTITEAAENYTPSIAVSENVKEGSGYEADVAVNDDKNGITDMTTGLHGNTTATFTNTLNGDVPTGIFSNMGLSIIVIAVAAAGAAVSLIIIKKKKSEED